MSLRLCLVTRLHNLLDILLVYAWYKHAAISLCYSTARYILTSNMTLTIFLFEALIIAVTTIFFGFVERIMKEDWVLYESFMRAQKIYMKLVDAMLLPTFVVEPSGRVLYANVKGRNLLALSRTKAKQQGKGGANLLSLVHPDFVKPLEPILKRAGRENVEPIEIPLLNYLVEPQEKAVEAAPAQGSVDTQLAMLRRLTDEGREARKTT